MFLSHQLRCLLISPGYISAWRQTDAFSESFFQRLLNKSLLIGLNVFSSEEISSFWQHYNMRLRPQMELAKEHDPDSFLMSRLVVRLVSSQKTCPFHWNCGNPQQCLGSQQVVDVIRRLCLHWFLRLVFNFTVVTESNLNTSRVAHIEYCVYRCIFVVRAGSTYQNR